MKQEMVSGTYKSGVGLDLNKQMKEMETKAVNEQNKKYKKAYH